MKKYLISINSKTDGINCINNQIVETSEPLQDLRRLLPEFVVQRGNSGNWNIVLWNRDTNTHLYYIAKTCGAR